MNNLITCSAVLLGLCLLLTGCPNRLPDSLEDRSQLRWNALVSGEIETAYSLLSPGYREAVTIEAYRNRLAARSVEWTGGEFLELSNCAEDTCEVKVNVGFKAYSPAPGVSEYEGEQELIEQWIKIGGDWFHVPKRI